MNINSPISHYFTQEHCIIQYSACKEPKPSKQPSIQSLIRGYWKKDYSNIEKSPRNNPDLPVLITSYSKEEPQTPKKKQFSEKLLNISNSFGSLSNRQFKTYTKILKDKLLEVNKKYQQKDRIKKQGKLFKGPYLRNIESPSSDQTRQYMQVSNKEIQLPKQLKLLDPIKRRSITNNQLTRRKISQTEQISMKKSGRLKSSKLNTRNVKQRPITPKIPDPQSQKLEQIYLKINHNAAPNILIFVFDGILGYDEQSYFGLQSDFVQSTRFIEYQQFRSHYYKSLNNNSSIYIIKNIKEIFKSLQKMFQIILLSTNYAQQLFEYTQEQKLPVNGIYKILSERHKFTLDINYVIQDLKLKLPQRIIFIQSFDNEKYNEYCGQLYYFPYVQQQFLGSLRMMSLPVINMQVLVQRFNSLDRFHHAEHFLAQLSISLLSDQSFHDYLQKNQFKLKRIDFAHLFKSIKQKLQSKQLFIKKLKPQNIQKSESMTKKKTIQRIVDSFGMRLKPEIITYDLVMRNKKIFKHIREYEQPCQNNLSTLYSEFDELIADAHYCEKLIDICYLLQI